MSVMLLALPLAVGAAEAQQGPNGLINPQRDCQTVVTCNYRKNGSYRGCLSSYSCRVCRMVASSCAASPSAAQGKCFRMQCSWGA